MLPRVTLKRLKLAAYGRNPNVASAHGSTAAARGNRIQPSASIIRRPTPGHSSRHTVPRGPSTTSAVAGITSTAKASVYPTA